MPTVILLLEKQKKVFYLPLMLWRVAAFAITKIQKAFCLPLMPWRAFTFASRGKSKQKRYRMRKPLKTHAAVKSAVPVPHRRAPPNSRMAQTCGGARRKETAQRAVSLRYPWFTIFTPWFWRAAGAW
jgi:hypothetical protein